jgi:hypothetical protein
MNDCIHGNLSLVTSAATKENIFDRTAGGPTLFSMLTQRAFAVILLALLALTGCKGFTTHGEREARYQAGAVKAAYRPNDQRPALPNLTTNSSLGDFLTYAMLNQPQIETAYYDWAGSVENITVARSLPDLQLTFQMYIQDVITSVMPGLMAQIPWLGKLRAQANAATAESRAKYFAFESAVLRVAYDVKQSYYQLWFLDKKIAVDREMLQLLSELEQIARAQNETGQATLQDVYRAQIEADRLKTEIANLEDSRSSLLAQFKAALGLAHDAGSVGGTNPRHRLCAQSAAQGDGSRGAPGASVAGPGPKIEIA